MTRDSIHEEELKRRATLALEDEEPDEEEGCEERPSKESVIQLDLLKKERTIIISEPVTPKLTQRFLSQALWLDTKSHDPIKVFINTPGGSADDGFAILDIIRMIQSPVYTICVGLNASAGTIILLGAPAERRLAMPNARIMIHQPSGGGRGRASDIEITADEILKLRRHANELIAAETKKRVEQVEKDTDRDYWMSAEEAKAYGLVSKVIQTLKEI